MADLEKINPVPKHDFYVRSAALRLAKAADLNTEVDGEERPAAGKTIWVDYGYGSYQIFYRLEITGHRYQMNWLRPLLGRKIYVQVDPGKEVVVDRKFPVR